MAGNYQRSLIATILFSVMLLTITGPGNAAWFTHQGVVEVSLKEEAACPNCKCCSTPPPGSCCDCCSAPTQPQYSVWD